MIKELLRQLLPAIRRTAGSICENNRMEMLRNGVEPWSVTLIDTGENTMTGGRLRRVRAVHRRRDLLPHLRRRRQRRRHRARSSSFHREQRRAGDADGGAAAGPVRRADARHRTDPRRRASARSRAATAPGSTAASSCSSRRSSTTSTATRRSGSGSRSRALAHDGSAGGLQAPRLLAADGHPARQDRPRGALGIRQGALEECW